MATSTTSSSSSPTSSSLWYSSISTNGGSTTTTTNILLSSSMAILYISYRMAIANYSPITDCDETYNYWEPLHFLQYNTGMQTWEYAKPYELRTYGFLVVPYYLILSTLARLLSHHDKRMIFHSVRSIIGAITAISELYYASGIWNTFGGPMAITTLLALALSPGMFHASSALLPSTAVMQYVMLSVGHTLHNYYCYNSNPNRSKYYERISILFGLMATLGTGWPFAAALFLPLGLRTIYLASLSSSSPSSVRSTTIFYVLIRTALHAISIQTLITIIDYYYYQSFTLPTWNILKYNAMQGDDTLYGIEPLSYYVKNILLNFNIMAICASLALPILFGKYLLLLLFQRQQQQQQQQSARFMLHAMMYSLSPMVIWILLIGPRPHKEERFLFPIYPFIALACSYTLQEIINGTIILVHYVLTTFSIKNNKNQRRHLDNRIRQLLYICFFLPVTLLSVSRSLALHTYYIAPLYVYSFLYDTIKQRNNTNNIQPSATTVCVAGEWYRFPGSFMLPQGTSLGFLPSSFKGQLPQPFIPSLGSAADPDQIPQPFNSRNREEPSRYIGNIASCDYVVELFQYNSDVLNDDDVVKKQLIMTDLWEEIVSFPFLDTGATTGTLGRTLYTPPWLRRSLGINIHFAKYSLLHRINDAKN